MKDKVEEESNNKTENRVKKYWRQFRDRRFLYLWKCQTFAAYLIYFGGK